MSFVVRKFGNNIVKMWTGDMEVEESALEQIKNVSSLPFVFKHLAIMPDVHKGYGVTIGSVIPTLNAVIPSAVGVDIGCGMTAVRTSLTASDLPDNLLGLRLAIESAVPVGRANNNLDLKTNDDARNAWDELLKNSFKRIVEKNKSIEKSRTVSQLGTLGGGNHFIEICIDENSDVWAMLHSGSRGVGNRIGTEYIGIAKREMERYFISLPDKDLSYLPKGTKHFDDYIFAVNWAQNFAKVNRDIMMRRVLGIMKDVLPEFRVKDEIIDCHHNYVSLENHFKKNVYVTRKGAVSARKGQLGIIPGSMGSKSFIVEGKGNLQSFNSCSHGAGRVMSRTAARRMFSEKDHRDQTIGVECDHSASVIDEIPAAYKPIEKVMNSQKDLVKIIHTLKQVVCVKG